MVVPRNLAEARVSVDVINFSVDTLRNTRDLKQPGRVCGRRREKTSEVWVENVRRPKRKKQMFKQAPVSARRRSR